MRRSLLSFALAVAMLFGVAPIQVGAATPQRHYRSYQRRAAERRAAERRAAHRRTLKRTGIGAAGGALVGALAGGGKGAGIGAVAGAGAGYLYDRHKRHEHRRR